MSDETIMPDGRPLFAWRNEIEGARRDRKDLELARREVEGWGRIRRILEAQQWQEWPEGDIVIRLKRNDVIGHDVPGKLPWDKAEVTAYPPRRVESRTVTPEGSS